MKKLILCTLAMLSLSYEFSLFAEPLKQGKYYDCLVWNAPNYSNIWQPFDQNLTINDWMTCRNHGYPDWIIADPTNHAIVYCSNTISCV